MSASNGKQGRVLTNVTHRFGKKREFMMEIKMHRNTISSIIPLDRLTP